MTLKSCPFCGSTKIELNDPDIPTRWVGCENCGAIGPDAKSDREAVELWNNRVEDTKEIKLCSELELR